MRRAHATAVSSALLVFLVAHAPCHPGLGPCPLASESSVPAASLVISEVYAHGLCADEYFALSNSGSGACNLRGWTITDGEGNITVSQDLWVAPGTSVSLSFNSSSYSCAYGGPPSICLDRGDQAGAVMVGSFRLGDQGDSLSLIAPDGTMVDSVRYGTSSDGLGQWLGDPVPEPRQGEVLRRVRDAAGCRDSDRSSDWTPFREFRYGYTMFRGFEADIGPGQATAFTSPDSSLAVIGSCIDRSERTIKLCAYEASSAELCSKLVAAVSRGVQVALLVDGVPAGGLSEDEVSFLSALAYHGADVRLLAGNASNGVVQHVLHMHAKYGVFDDRETVVMSENFVGSALPPNQLRGNRGWGLLVTSQGLAAYMSQLFESDSRLTRADVRLWRSDARYNEGALLAEPEFGPPGARVIEPMESRGPAHISVHVSPDCSESSPFLCDLLSGTERVVGEQFQTDLQWAERWTDGPSTNPLVAAIAASSANGSCSRMLFDSSWFNADRNSATCAYLEAASSASGGDSRFRMMVQGGPVEVLHNKGLVVDDRVSVISSNNWVFASFARNRELAVVIDSAELASFFSSAFELDWSGDRTAPVADAGADFASRLGDRVELNGSLSWDDHVVSSWSWDLYSDGVIDSRSPSVVFYATRPGTHEAVLTVEDPWGNRDTDVVVFTVLPAERSPAPLASGYYMGLVAAVGALGALGGVALARCLRRRRRGKVNQGLDD